MIVLKQSKIKSAEKLANAEDAFGALDDAGGVELSCLELARGLRSVKRSAVFVMLILPAAPAVLPRAHVTVCVKGCHNTVVLPTLCAQAKCLGPAIIIERCCRPAIVVLMLAITLARSVPLRC
jgi:hypothetical protein